MLKFYIGLLLSFCMLTTIIVTILTYLNKFQTILRLLGLAIDKILACHTSIDTYLFGLYNYRL